MIRRLIPVALLLGAVSANAQVGIGTKTPHKSAELLIESSNRGLLIPNVALSNVKDQKTITNGNVNSLMVFNTTANEDITPGYYYWYVDSWNRLTRESDIPSVVVNNFQEILNIENNKVENLIKEIVLKTEGNVIYEGNKIYYINNQGDKIEIDLGDFVTSAQTLTKLDYNTDTHILSYQDEHGVTKEIDLNVGALSYSTTLNRMTYVDADGTSNHMDLNTTALNYDHDRNLLLYTDSNGNITEVNLKDIVVAFETVTSITDNDNGTYTYINEKNQNFLIDIPSSIVESFSTIIKAGPVTVGGDVFNSIGEYIQFLASFSVEMEDSEFITVTGSGKANDPYIVSIKEGTADSMLITNANGDLEWATIESIVQANETITSITDNPNGTYTYINEEGTEFLVDIPSSIVESFSTIIKAGPVTVGGDVFNSIGEYIQFLASFSVEMEDSEFITVTGSGKANDPYIVSIKEGTADSMLITNANGDLEWATIDSIVQNNETVTSIEDHKDGTYTYTNEKNQTFIIDVPSSVANNFETIVNHGPVTINGEGYLTIEQYIKHLANSSIAIEGVEFVKVTGTGTATDPYKVSFDKGANNSLLITNAEGKLEWATITDIVNNNVSKGNLTLSTALSFVNNTDGNSVLLKNTFIDVATGGITTDKLANEAVTTDKIAKGNKGDVLTTDQNGDVQWTSAEAVTTNTLVLDGNKLTSTVNGVGSFVELNEFNISSTKTITGVGITVNDEAKVGSTLKDVTLSITPGNNGEVMITKDGKVSWAVQSEVIPSITNKLESKGNKLTSDVSGNADSTDIINSIGNSLNTDGHLVTTVNGIASEALDLGEAIAKGQKTTSVVNGTNTTVTSKTDGNNTEYTVNVSKEAIQGAVTLDGDVTGKPGENTLSKIQGTPVETAVKSANQVLTYDGTNWVAATPNIGVDQVTDAKALSSDGVIIFEEDGKDNTTAEKTVLKATKLKIKEESITTGHIANGTIKPEDIAEAGENQVLVTGADKKPIWVAQNSIIVETTNKLSSTGNKLSSTVNGIEDTADIVNSIENKITDTTLTTSVNGVEANVDLKQAIQAGQKNTVVTGKGIITAKATTTDDTTTYEVSVNVTGDVTLDKDNKMVVGAIQNTPVSNVKPSDKQVLVFKEGKWSPSTLEISSGDLTNKGNLSAAVDDAIDVNTPSTNTTIEVTNGEDSTLKDTSIRVKQGSITTGHIQDGTIKPEDIANAGGNQVLVTDKDGKPQWEAKRALEFFYMPAVIFDTSKTGTATRDLYTDYVNQFTGGKVGDGYQDYNISHGPEGTTPVVYKGGIVGSTDAPVDIATFGKSELYYYVTYYDQDVFSDLAIDKDGKLTYTVKSTAKPSSYMNIVFVIK